MGRAQEDEMLWDADKEGRVILRHSLAGAPEQKRNEMGRAQQDETLWDADNQRKVTRYLDPTSPGRAQP